MSKWISVKDGMPNEGQEVLIYPEVQMCGDINTAYIHNGKFLVIWEDSYQSGEDEVRPTHWMDYPPPPK